MYWDMGPCIYKDLFGLRKIRLVLLLVFTMLNFVESDVWVLL